MRDLLKGNLSPVIRHFKEEMKALAANLQFEKAEYTRKKIAYLEDYYQSRSVVTGMKGGDKDVFSILKEKDIAYVNYLMVRGGLLYKHKPIKLKRTLMSRWKKYWCMQYSICVPHLIVMPGRLLFRSRLSTLNLIPRSLCLKGAIEKAGRAFKEECGLLY
ncbi:hypothetical protein LWM68_35730 [Niabella sp. W65]|nr:hypothetical protein [Niabella sp. W65]MCH7367640.1 hypothetical protein [Niabella sp. W65]